MGDEEARSRARLAIAPYTQIVSGPIRKNTKVVGTRFLMGGLLGGRGLRDRGDGAPVPGDTQAKTILEWLEKGVEYAGACAQCEVDGCGGQGALGEVLAAGSDQEVRSPDAHGALHHHERHGQHGTNKKFGEEMEECYAAIKKMYPVRRGAGQSLMPVFLFRDKDEYSEYYAKIAGITPRPRTKSKGHAWKDYYATYFDATKRSGAHPRGDAPDLRQSA